VRFEEQDVEKMAVELKEVIEKATTKKKTIVKGAKGTGRKIEWWDKKYKKLKKEAVKALRE
jgi:5-methylcytosine-specific restriction endonuclease McrBC GTP-binding regulatory subunit McrB